LAAVTAGTSITASYNSATETLTLTGSDTLADFNQVLESVTFQSTSLNATDFGQDPTRTLTWTVNDGVATSLPQTETVTIDTGPTLGVAASTSFTEGQAPATVTLSPTVSIADNLGPPAWTTEGTFSLGPAIPQLPGTDLVGGKIYVLDGSDLNGNLLDTIYVYDPATNAWTLDSTTDLVARTRVGSAADAQGNIYVIGGADARGADLAEVTRFDTATNTVTQVASLPFGLHGGI